MSYVLAVWSSCIVACGPPGSPAPSRVRAIGEYRAPEGVDDDARWREVVGGGCGSGERCAIRAAGQRSEVVGIVRVGLPGRRRELVRIAQIRRDAMDHALLRPVGTNRANHLAARVVEHRGLAPEQLLAGRLIAQADREEGLVRLDGPPLVVVDLPAAHDHIRRILCLTSPADHASAGRGLVRGQDVSAERRRAEQHIVGLRAGLQQPAEAVRVLDRDDGRVARGQRHVGVR